MGFNAASAVQALDWDFTKYGGGVGTSPEPTTQQIEKFSRRLDSLQRALQRLQTAHVGKTSELSDEQLREQMTEWESLSFEEGIARIDEEQRVRMAELGEAGDSTALDQKLCELVAETLSNCPTMEQIQALPHRVRFAFYGWVTQELLLPEIEAAGSKPSLSLVRNG